MPCCQNLSERCRRHKSIWPNAYNTSACYLCVQASTS